MKKQSELINEYLYTHWYFKEELHIIDLGRNEEKTMNKEKTQKIYKIIMLIALVAFITFIITTVFLYNTNLGNTKYVLVSNNDNTIAEELARFRTIIDEYYLGEIDENKLKESAIKGYVEGLGDEYSEYITKEEYEEYEINIMGNYVGIGIYMSVYKDSDEIVVLSPIEDSPAESAGILTGDIILKVDGIEYDGEHLDEASAAIKGEEGTKVKIEIKRNEQIMELEIERKKVIVNPVKSEVKENNIGYIKLTSFDEETSKIFKEKYEELQKQNIQSLIIDLRDNGGGIVQEALTIADYMLEKDSKMLITVNKKENEVIETAKTDPIITIPVVLLVNENSASASEILAGALKDNNRAKIVGTKTYGKGVIQELLRLKDGSAIKLTTEEYYTPNRTKINKVGIEPDELVENKKDEKTDLQLQKAIEMVK